MKYGCSSATLLSIQEKAIHEKIFQGDYGPAMNWYKVTLQNCNEPDEIGLDPKLTHPVLMVNASKDVVGIPVTPQQFAPFSTDVEFAMVDTGHWVQLEATQQVNEILEGFFEKVLS
jgi:soluble epoxide hydrolase/lipid-phosphate phosphatase